MSVSTNFNTKHTQTSSHNHVYICALFEGYLMNTYEDRSEGVSWLLAAMTDESTESIRLLAEKVKIIFLGKYQDHDVLAKGNVYIPEGKTAKKFSKVLGEEVNIILFCFILNIQTVNLN